VRPFTTAESTKLVKKKDEAIFLGDGSLSFNVENKENQYPSRLFGPSGLRKIVDVVDDRMLIFDPPENNPLSEMNKNIMPASGKRTTRFREHRFVFDKLFDEDARQDEVYHNTTRPLLDSVLDGYNSTVFAYGATGCGKTHTISGTPEEPGIIFLTMKELFERIDDLKDSKHIEVSLSYLEIYNETIRDLMEPENNSKILTLREDSNNRISVSNLSTHNPQSVEDVMNMIIIGNKNRTSSPTEANATSSRSHAVLQINVSQKNRTADITESHMFATLSIIDLAGSERAAATKNRGERLQEGANINKSLLALGNCINALCDVRRKNHIPYRDSKLTRLLKFSLGGNCKTVMIVCISPSSHHYDETLNTLKYADRAKQIKTKIMRNQHSLNRHVGSYLKMITEQKQEIEELRNREQSKIEQAVESYKIKKDRVSIGVLETIDSLKQTLNSKKFEQLKLKKSLILCKRRIVFCHKVELTRYLKTFESLERQPEEIAGITRVLRDILSKLDIKIDELETIYKQESELDLILANSDNGIRRLTELEGWSNYDKLMLDTSLSLIRDSVERKIMHNALIGFDQIINQEQFSGNFRFISQSIVRTISQISYLKSNSQELEIIKGEFQLIIDEFYREFEDSLHDLMNIDHKFEKFASSFQYDITSEISIPTSPIRKIARSKISSPLSSSPRLSLSKLSSLNSKVTKSTSGLQNVTKNKAIKKVRWDIPDESQLSLNVLESEDSDVSMNDLAKATDEIEIDSASNNVPHDEYLLMDQTLQDESFTTQKKRKSLTSMSLNPNSNNTNRRSVLPDTENKNNEENAINRGTGLGAPIRVDLDSIN
jgi:kinesin family protein 18/19